MTAHTLQSSRSCAVSSSCARLCILPRSQVLNSRENVVPALVQCALMHSLSRCCAETARGLRGDRLRTFMQCTFVQFVTLLC